MTPAVQSHANDRIEREQSCSPRASPEPRGEKERRHRPRVKRIASHRLRLHRARTAGPISVSRIGASREELFAAFHLVYEQYLRSGLMKPNSYRMRVTPYHLLPSTEVLVALDRGAVTCTMSLVRDGELGLPMESVYHRGSRQPPPAGALVGGGVVSGRHA